MWLTRLTATCLLICLPVALASASEAASDRYFVHLLNRLAFGPTLEELDYVKKIGI